MRGDRAALAAVQPAVRPPGQRVGDGVCVLHAEPAEQHFGVAIRNIVAGPVGIEEKIGRLQYEHAAMPERDSGGKVQPADEVRSFAGGFRTVRIEQDGDAVRSPGAARRRLGHAVVYGAGITIDLDTLQSRGIRILQVLNNPQPAAIIKFDSHRLADERLRSNQLYLEAVRDLHTPGRFVR